jgi:lipopolysaccharide transport system ATP-binding protein
MASPIISVENLGKRYRLRHQEKVPYTTFRDALTQAARRLLAPRSVNAGDTPTAEDFWALQNVSFEIGQGEVVGIIGRNGAGKSTLLKILSRITEPTTGRVRLRGRVASLLEVGTGFHPELTGRENIFLNGAILGMSKAEIRSKFDEIVAFAEVERFLDTPVKHYSSGMYVRLAFAVAAHLEPEILVVDEVLAVGDSQFQSKCMARMRSVAGGGRTVLFVSHNMSAVLSLCDRCLLLRNGTVLHDADVTTVVEAHQQLSQNPDEVSRRVDTGSTPLFIRRLTAKLEIRGSDSVLLLDAEIYGRRKHKAAFVAFDIIAANGTCVMQAVPTQEAFLQSLEGTHHVRCSITLPPLIPGHYDVSMWVGSHYTEMLDVAAQCASFDILHSPTHGRTFPHTADHGFVVPRSRIDEYRVAQSVADVR